MVEDGKRAVRHLDVSSDDGAQVRVRAGLKDGDRVEFVVEGERTIIRPAHPANNPFEKYAGALPVFASEREMDAWVRELRDEESSDQ